MEGKAERYYGVSWKHFRRISIVAFLAACPGVGLSTGSIGTIPPSIPEKTEMFPEVDIRDLMTLRATVRHEKTEDGKWRVVGKGFREWESGEYRKLREDKARLMTEGGTDDPVFLYQPSRSIMFDKDRYIYAVMSGQVNYSGNNSIYSLWKVNGRKAKLIRIVRQDSPFWTSNVYPFQVITGVNGVNYVVGWDEDADEGGDSCSGALMVLPILLSSDKPVKGMWQKYSCQRETLLRWKYDAGGKRIGFVVGIYKEDFEWTKSRRTSLYELHWLDLNSGIYTSDNIENTDNKCPEVMFPRSDEWEQQDFPCSEMQMRVLIDHPDLGVRLDGIACLASEGSRKSVSRIVAMLGKDGSTNFIDGTIDVIERFPRKERFGPLVLFFSRRCLGGKGDWREWKFLMDYARYDMKTMKTVLSDFVDRAKKENGWNAMAIISGLGKEGAKAIPILLKKAMEGDVNVKVNAMGYLGKIGVMTDEVRIFLVAEIESVDGRERAAAYSAIADMDKNGEGLWKYLYKAYEEEYDCCCKLTLIRALGKVAHYDRKAVVILEKSTKKTKSMQNEIQAGTVVGECNARVADTVAVALSDLTSAGLENCDE